MCPTDPRVQRRSASWRLHCGAPSPPALASARDRRPAPSPGAGRRCARLGGPDQLDRRRAGQPPRPAAGVHSHPRPAADPTGRQTSTRALANLWDVNREAGIERLLLASVIESPADVDRIREAVPGADIQIFWLVASYSTLAERIRARQVPTALEWRLQRAQSLIERWQQEPPAHAHVIDASDRSPTEIAAEIVSRSGWLEVRERR
jgi:hypothetical protein